jgi:hypothetical protein
VQSDQSAVNGTCSRRSIAIPPRQHRKLRRVKFEQFYLSFWIDLLVFQITIAELDDIDFG